MSDATASRGEHLADGGIASNSVYYPKREAIDKINREWEQRTGRNPSDCIICRGALPVNNPYGPYCSHSATT